MNRLKKLLVFGVMVVLVVGCQAKPDAFDFIDIKYQGLDGYGTAEIKLNEDKMVKDIFGYDSILDVSDTQKLEAIVRVLGDVSVSGNERKDMKNGDELILKVTLGNHAKKYLKGGTKNYRIEGLRTGTALDDQSIKDNVLITFKGVSGRGSVKLENNFKESTLKGLRFKVEKNGNLKNGDNVKVMIENPDFLSRNHYVLSEEGSFEITVNGLDEVASHFNEITNFSEVEEMLKSEIQGMYRSGVMNQVETELVAKYYRHLSLNGANINANGDGSYAYLLRVTRNLDTKSEKTFYEMVGFEKIVLDGDRKANLSKLNVFKKSFKKDYTLDTVDQILSGEGYLKID